MNITISITRKSVRNFFIKLFIVISWLFVVPLLVCLGYYAKSYYDDNDNRFKDYFKTHSISRKMTIGLIILSWFGIITIFIEIGWFIKLLRDNKAIYGFYIKNLVHRGVKYR